MAITANRYQLLATRTLRPELDLAIEGDAAILLMGVIGLCGETGECAEIVKKHVFSPPGAG